MAILNAHTFNDKIDADLKKNAPLKVPYWESVEDTLLDWPEDKLAEIRDRPSIGVAFSGGGYVSALHSFGAMRALHEMDFVKKIKYTSAVSGGTWFTTPYTYLQSSTDENFFGRRMQSDSDGTLDLINITPDKFNTALRNTMNSIWDPITGKAIYPDQSFLAAAVLKDKTFHEISMIERTKKKDHDGEDWMWAYYAGSEFLKPFGLFSRDTTSKYFTWSKSTRNDAIAINSHLQPTDFHYAIDDLDDLDDPNVKKRPYPILGVSMFTKLNKLVAARQGLKKSLRNGNTQFEITPLYSGAIKFNGLLGGGVIPSYGVNRSLKAIDTDEKIASLKKIHGKQKIFTLSTAIGAASAAYSIIRGDVFKIKASYWPIKDDHDDVYSGRYTRKVTLADGGYHENLGIMPLLRRQVKKIIVCESMSTHFTAPKSEEGLEALSPSELNDLVAEYLNSYDWYDSAFGETLDLSLPELNKLSDENKTRYLKERISGGMAHLFGHVKLTTNAAFLMTKKANQVFEKNKLDALVNGLKANHEDTEIAFFKDTYKVVENKNYGIKNVLRKDLKHDPNGPDEPYEVEIIWFLPNYSERWSTTIKEWFDYRKNTNAPLSERIEKDLFGGRDGGSGVAFRGVIWPDLGYRRIQNGFPNLDVARFDLSKEVVTLMSSYSTWCFEQIEAQKDENGVGILTKFFSE